MERRRRTLLAVARAVIGLGLLAIVIAGVDLREFGAALAGVRWLPLAAALAAQTAITLLRTFRWRDVLLACGLTRGFGRLFVLMVIGLFFNSFLPTSIGGDLVRGYSISGGRSDLVPSYASLVVERLLGVIGLACVAAVASLVALGLPQLPLERRLMGLTAAVAGAATLSGVIAFAWRGWRRRLVAVSWFGGRISNAAAGLDRAFGLFDRRETHRVRIVIVSLLLQVLAVAFHLGCARAVGLDTPALVFFLVVPASIAASMLPVTINGLGVREGVLVGLLAAYGAPSAGAAAFAVLSLIVSRVFPLIGGLLYAFDRPARLDDGGPRREDGPEGARRDD